MRSFKQIITTLQAAQPQDRFQSLMAFPNGTAMVVFAGGTITFENHQHVDRVCDLIDRRPRAQENLGGDGI